jgi:hypothetical protein
MPPEERLQHNAWVAEMNRQGASRNVETAKNELENRNFLEKSADALTGFASEKMLKGNLEEAQTRLEQVSKVEKIYKREGEYANLNPEQAIEVGGAENKAEYKKSTQGNKRVSELADTSASRAARAGQVAEVVQDVNAGLAYTGGFVL